MIDTRDELREFKERAEITWGQFSRLSGVPVATLQAIASKQRYISARSASGIARVMGVPAQSIVQTRERVRVLKLAEEQGVS